jgi:hypothetical protein
MNTYALRALVLAGLSAITILPAAHADPWNQKTVFTFSGPVEIPGQVLPAGTYVFKLADSQSSRNIVQVFNKAENHVFGTFLAIPDYRRQPSDKPIVKFEERASGSPQAIKAWFYPGRSYGHEFVYPKQKAVEIAQVNHTPVPAMPTELAANTAKPDMKLDSPEVAEMNVAVLKLEQPSGEEAELAESPVTPDSVETPAAALPEQLPSTASVLPLLGLSGLALLVIAGGLRLSAAKAT